MKFIFLLLLFVLFGCNAKRTPEIQKPKIEFALDEYYDGIIKLQNVPPGIALIDQTINFDKVENDKIKLEFITKKIMGTNSAYRLILTIKSTGEAYYISLPGKGVVGE